MRSYTVQEIDSLREAVRNWELWGSYGRRQDGSWSRPYSEPQITQQVEERVRTYMLADITVKDLLNSEK